MNSWTLRAGILSIPAVGVGFIIHIGVVAQQLGWVVAHGYASAQCRTYKTMVACREVRGGQLGSRVHVCHAISMAYPHTWAPFGIPLAKCGLKTT